VRKLERKLAFANDQFGLNLGDHFGSARALG